MEMDVVVDDVFAQEAEEKGKVHERGGGGVASKPRLEEKSFKALDFWRAIEHEL